MSANNIKQSIAMENPDTPRTNGATGEGNFVHCVDADFARDLERQIHRINLLLDEQTSKLLESEKALEQARIAVNVSLLALRNIRALKPKNMACDHFSREMGLDPDEVFEICDNALPRHEN